MSDLLPYRVRVVIKEEVDVMAESPEEAVAKALTLGKEYRLNVSRWPIRATAKVIRETKARRSRNRAQEAGRNP